MTLVLNIILASTLIELNCYKYIKVQILWTLVPVVQTSKQHSI